MTISARSDLHNRASDRAPAAKWLYDPGFLLALALAGILLSYLCGIEPNFFAS